MGSEDQWQGNTAVFTFADKTFDIPHRALFAACCRTVGVYMELREELQGCCGSSGGLGYNTLTAFAVDPAKQEVQATLIVTVCEGCRNEVWVE